MPGINQKDPSFHLLSKEDGWGREDRFRHGVDLFNHGCYWEAHEAWEDLWLPLEKEDPVRVFIQGLIQGSAALLKIRLGQPKPAHSIWSRGKERLSKIRSGQPDGSFQGIQIDDFCHRIDEILQQEDPNFKKPQINLKDHS